MILAPMQGLTEVLMRRVYEECFPGAIPLAVAPFIALTRNLRFSMDNAQIRDVLPERNAGSIPVVPQVLGKEPEEFVLVANRLYDMGYTEVNWNMGCPMRAIVAKHRGCGLMPWPDEVRAILESVVPRLQGRLSVKVRLGLKEKDEIFRMVPVLNDFPLASVTIHARLGRQGYSGVPDVETFGQVLPLLRHPVIYNGDICTAGDAARIRERFPQVADVMVGRGVFYNPLLPLEASEPMPVQGSSALVRRFIRRLMEEIRLTLPTDEAKVRKSKEYWSLLWHALPISEMQARTVLRAQELTVVDNLIAEYTQ